MSDMKTGLYTLLLMLFYFVSAVADEKVECESDMQALAAAREVVKHHHGGEAMYLLMVDRLEHQESNDESLTLWDAQAWYGGDINKFWLKSEGEYAHDEGQVEEVEIQALYSRAVTAFWDLQAGLRYDLKPTPERAYAVLGLQGLAPYWFEVDAAAFLSDEGKVSMRVELEYELRLTQRLIFQPRVEMTAALENDREIGSGAGFSSLESGFRLRYEIAREFAPYVGLNWTRSFGDTRKFRLADGKPATDLSFVAGIRLWY